MIKSKKLKMGLSYATIAPIAAIVAVGFGMPYELIATCIWSGCAIVITNMVTHMVTDCEYIKKQK